MSSKSELQSIIKQKNTFDILHILDRITKEKGINYLHDDISSLLVRCKRLENLGEIPAALIVGGVIVNSNLVARFALEISEINYALFSITDKLIENSTVSLEEIIREIEENARPK